MALRKSPFMSNLSRRWLPDNTPSATYLAKDSVGWMLSQIICIVGSLQRFDLTSVPLTYPEDPH